MKRFKSILAVLPEDSLAEVAFARAAHLARVNGAALTLVDLVEGASGDLARLLAAFSGIIPEQLLINGEANVVKPAGFNESRIQFGEPGRWFRLLGISLGQPMADIDAPSELQAGRC